MLPFLLHCSPAAEGFQEEEPSLEDVLIPGTQRKWWPAYGWLVDGMVGVARPGAPTHEVRQRWPGCFQSRPSNGGQDPDPLTFKSCVKRFLPVLQAGAHL